MEMPQPRGISVSCHDNMSQKRRRVCARGVGCVCVRVCVCVCGGGDCLNRYWTSLDYMYIFVRKANPGFTFKTPIKVY